MATQAEPKYYQDARREGRLIVTDVPKFELDSYIANYNGKARIERLYHMGMVSPYLYREALSLAIAAAKEGKDVDVYEQLVALIAQIDPKDPLAVLDAAWVKRVQSETAEETSRLEAELKGYKNNLIKESIRMGYDQAGQHYQDIGNLKDAEKAFSKEREYCQTSSHMAIMQSRLVSVALERRAWMTVVSNALKIRDSIHNKPEAVVQLAILSAIIGLAQLHSREYRNAANSFIDTNESFLHARLVGEMSDDPAGLRGVISPNDVAIYGALCALASMDRAELQSRVLDNTSFRQFLELEPHLRRAISFFVAGKFSQCLAILESYRVDYLLDANLYLDYNDLFDRVRRKAIVQYFIPFSRVTFTALAEAFNTDVETIQTSLIQLIEDRTLPARLDLDKGLLVANTTDTRIQAHHDALESAREFERTLHQRILRMEAIQAGLEVHAPRKAPEGASGDLLMGVDNPRGKGAVRPK